MNNKQVTHNREYEAFCLDRMNHYADRLLQEAPTASDKVWNWMFDQYTYYEARYSEIQIIKLLNEVNIQSPGVEIIPAL